MKNWFLIILIVALLILTLFGVRYGIPFRGRSHKTLHPPSRFSGMTLKEQVNQAIERGIKWLASKQSSDGAWRSETYGLLKSGQSMTPFTLYALTQLANSKSQIPISNKRLNDGLRFLLDQINPDGSVGMRGIPDYPTYSTALALIVLTRLKPDNWQNQAKLLLGYLKSQQLIDNWGWSESDNQYGGWGIGGWIKKPADPMPEVIKNLVIERVDMSHTVFVLEALKSINLEETVPHGTVATKSPLVKALVFVKRCQNFSEDTLPGGPKLFDGGFIFAPEAILGNKAGPAEKATDGFNHYRSYGSMTADGVRALLFCGLDKDHPRVKAGIKWLVDNFRVDATPGFSSEPQPPWAQGVVFYYYWSLARLLNELDIAVLERDSGHAYGGSVHHGGCAEGITEGTDRLEWAEQIAVKLIQVQRVDGSWVNPVGLMKEDDPLISTNFALMTLHYCYEYIH